MDVEDNRTREEGGGEKRSQDRGRDRDRDRDRKPRYSDEKLQALAKRAAEKATDATQDHHPRAELLWPTHCPPDHRDIEGASTTSEMRDGLKVVQVVPTNARYCRFCYTMGS